MNSLRLSTPLMGLFWEAWQLSYKRFLIRVTGAILIGSLIMFYLENQALAMLVVVLAAVIQGPFPSMAGSSSEDSGGFPFRLGFTRPIPTWLLVLFPMLYFGVVCVLSYIIPLLVLSLVYDIAPPFLSASATILTLALVFAAMQWWSNSKSIRFVAWIGLTSLLVAVLIRLDRGVDPGQDFITFEPLTYGMLILISMVAMVLAVWGTEKQRHNASSTLQNNRLLAFFRTLLEGDWGSALSNIERGIGISCPTSSPLKAEVWKVFSRQASILLVTSIVSSIAVLNFWWFDEEGAAPTLGLIGLISLTILFHLAFRDLYGIQKREGVSYLSKFEATLPVASAQLIGLRVLMSVVSIFVGVALFVGIISLAGPFVLDSFDQLKTVVFARFESLSLLRFLTWGLVGLVEVVALGICLSTLAAFSSVARTRITLTHLRRFSYYALVMAVYGFLVHEENRMPDTVVQIMVLQVWLFGVFVAVSTVMLFRSVLRDYVLSVKSVAVGVLIWFAFSALVYVLVQGLVAQNGVVIIQMTPLRNMLLGLFCLLPLMAYVLAPWAYGQIRHR